MSFTNHPLQEQWDRFHRELRDTLQEEVRLTRELLSNMHQEEITRLLADEGMLHQVLSEQSRLFERISQHRLNRAELTRKMEQMVIDEKKLPSLDEILPPTEEITTEIFSLTDQLLFLTERMKRQHSSNQTILPDRSRVDPLPFVQPARPKRKAAIATYNLNK